MRKFWKGFNSLLGETTEQKFLGKVMLVFPLAAIWIGSQSLFLGFACLCVFIWAFFFYFWTGFTAFFNFEGKYYKDVKGQLDREGKQIQSEYLNCRTRVSREKYIFECLDHLYKIQGVTNDPLERMIKTTEEEKQKLEEIKERVLKT